MWKTNIIFTNYSKYKLLISISPFFQQKRSHIDNGNNNKWRHSYWIDTWLNSSADVRGGYYIIGFHRFFSPNNKYIHSKQIIYLCRASFSSQQNICQKLSELYGTKMHVILCPFKGIIWGRISIIPKVIYFKEHMNNSSALA